MSTAEEIRATIEPALLPLGLVVEDVTVTPAGKRRLVRVLVDTDISSLDDAETSSPVPPLSLDDVADATRVVSELLDGSDVMGSAPYVLEVSSPGVGRPLTTRDQFRRQVGRLVEVLRDESPDEGRDGGSVSGRLREVGVDHLTIEVPATKKAAGRTERIPLDSVRRGTVQVEFKRSGSDAGPAEQTGSGPADADMGAGEPGPEEEI